MLAAVFFTLVCGVLATYVMARRPENAASLLCVLSVFFGLIPAGLIVAGSTFEFYSYRSFLRSSADLFSGPGADEALIYFSLVCLGLCAGVFAALTMSRPAAVSKPPPRPRNARSLAMVWVVLFGVWCALMVREWLVSGLDIRDFFTPAVRADRLSNTPGFLYALMMTLPIALMLSTRWVKGGRPFFLLFLALAILTCLTTHQRREIVTVILAASGALLIRPDYRVHMDVRGRLRRARMSIAAGLGIGLAAVPIFWYARVFLTSLARGRDVDVFAIRGVEELVFGSPATAFGPFVLIHNQLAIYGPDPLGFLLRIVSIPIPRLLWPGKPSDLDTALQESYGLYENPSAFWSGELYNALGVLAVPAAAAFGFFLARSQDRDVSSSSPFEQARAVAVICLTVALFKNGFGIFAMRWMVLIVLLYVLWSLSGFRYAYRHKG